jgi:tetratricopeptide (TPR) repeat protein
MQAAIYPTPDDALRQTRPSLRVPPAPPRDALGYRISGANAAALEHYQEALARWQGWRSGAEPALAEALEAAPHFVMARLLQAWLCVCNRDPRRLALAHPLLAQALRLPANERERMHMDALRAVLADDYELAKSRLGHLLRRYPRDVLALQVAHVFDYGTGDAAALDGRVAAVLPAWSRAMPGYHAVLAMHAFSLEECGHYELAARQAGAALELEPRDARAHHVMAHLFEMTDRPADGVRWMHERRSGWLRETLVATHCWWHVALFHLAQGDVARALACYDGPVRAGHSEAIADLVDASSLLWRLALAGADTGARWAELAAAWAAHAEDRFCSFNDLHAMLAFVGAGDWALAQRLERSLLLSQVQPTRHGASTRLLGLPACRAVMAFGRGDNLLAITLLASLPALAHRLGGSHAQRDVLNLTLLQAVERVRRPARRQAAAHVR